MNRFSICFVLLLASAATGCASRSAGHVAAGASAAYPSCDLAAQRALDAPTGGTIADPRQAHIAQRAKILQADIATARTARKLSQDRADRLWQRVQSITTEMNGYVQKQGFLSAAERASYDRELDAVAGKLCG